ncbi:mitochondrial potassium channel-like isoform X2 [Dreissena polymorpha]|uniref:Coiled-coil domain-containing protein 51 n=1 Tax=Dreissena polymorpha TaxID=45954 RepID=A0A9D4GQ03_DREPO|nr:mitochondrial potassium channel-like isoform X2 [Dreissena polymorpha]KAH3819255.1 hypothetical protein DPMN_120989 [Dreissena polymorpha]
MALCRRILRLSIHAKHCRFVVRRYAKPITGYESADNALQAVTGGRINRWLDAYEDLVGLTEVRQAQDQVTQAESSYRSIQEQRRSTQQQLTKIQAKIKAIATEIEKTKRGTDAYLGLVTKENEIIKEEKEVLEQVTVLEESEKQSFTLLSSALRESHEKERARAERMKYWGIMGSIIGAVIGIFGSTVNSYMRMKELRNLVTTAAESGQIHREKMMELIMSVNEQYGKIYQFLADIRSATGITPPAKQTPAKISNNDTTASESNLEELISTLKQNEVMFREEINKLGEILLVKQGRGDSEGKETVVYVGPEMQSLLHTTEKSIEKKLVVQTCVYVLAAVSVPILLKIFSGS